MSRLSEFIELSQKKTSKTFLNTLLPCEDVIIKQTNTIVSFA